MSDPWFQLHLPDERARTMNRKAYYAARHYLRRVRHIIYLRYANARLDGDTVILPSTDDVMPARFQ